MHSINHKGNQVRISNLAHHKINYFKINILLTENHKSIILKRIICVRFYHSVLYQQYVISWSFFPSRNILHLFSMTPYSPGHSFCSLASYSFFFSFASYTLSPWPQNTGVVQSSFLGSLLILSKPIHLVISSSFMTLWTIC